MRGAEVANIQHESHEADTQDHCLEELPVVQKLAKHENQLEGCRYDQ